MRCEYSKTASIRISNSLDVLFIYYFFTKSLFHDFSY